MSKKIRSKDQVIILAGNDKGKIGEVIAKTKDRILVKDVDVRTKHVKPQGQNKKGEIIKVERPIHISNVRLCVENDPKIKVKLKVDSKGEKELVYKQSGQAKVYRSIIKHTKTKKK